MVKSDQSSEIDQDRNSGNIPSNTNSEANSAAFELFRDKILTKEIPLTDTEALKVLASEAVIRTISILNNIPKAKSKTMIIQAIMVAMGLGHYNDEKLEIKDVANPGGQTLKTWKVYLTAANTAIMTHKIDDAFEDKLITTVRGVGYVVKGE